MTQPTSHGFGALPRRSWPSVVVEKEIAGSRHVRLLVTSALCVSAGETGVVLESVTEPGPKSALPHHVCQAPGVDRASGPFTAGEAAEAVPATSAAAAAQAARGRARRRQCTLELSPVR